MLAACFGIPEVGDIFLPRYICVLLLDICS